MSPTLRLGGFAVAVLVVNVLWLGLAFQAFALRPRRAARMLVPPSASGEQAHAALIGSLRFLGGMNLGMAVLSLAALAQWLGRHQAGGAVPLYLASMVAHGSQLACNVPFALRGGRAGGAPWDVLRGPMAYIFVIDGLCTVANGAALWSVL